MRLNLKATQLVLSDEIRSYFDKRLESLNRLLDLDDPTVLIDAELGRTTRHHQSGDIFFAEINIYRGSESFRAVKDATNLTAAIDGAQEDIAQEIASQKEKRRSLFRRGGLVAKALLHGGYDSLAYLGRPAKAGLRYLKGRWRRKNTE